MKYITVSTEETLALGKAFGKRVSPGSTLCFFGDLGAGKTTFIKGVVNALTGFPEEQIGSPTFSLLNIYEGVSPVYHFDLYRLTDEASFLDLGFDEFLFSKGVNCIEWSERIPSLIPPSAYKITLLHDGGNKRSIFYEIPEY